MEENKEENKEEKIEGNNVENDIIELKKTIETQKIQLEELDDRFKRVAAEFENYKKRSSKERETLYNSLKSDVILTILPVVDNLEKAVDAKTEDKNYEKKHESESNRRHPSCTGNYAWSYRSTDCYCTCRRGRCKAVYCSNCSLD